MKCPKRDSTKKPSIAFITSKKNYICSCVTKRGSRYKDDKVWLCMKGALSEVALEMTENESLGIISVLTASLFGIKKLQEEVEK